MSPPQVHPSAVIDDGALIGDDTRIWHFTHVMGTARLGRRCVVGQGVFVGDHVVVGNGVKLQNGTNLYDGVTLEDDVFCGPAATFTNDLTPRAPYPKGREGFVATLVRRGASIGANATVVCGVTIGRWAMIGAGAVVHRDVPDHALVVGNPARRIGWACECGLRLPEPEPTTTCPCGRGYRLDGERLTKADAEVARHG